MKAPIASGRDLTELIREIFDMEIDRIEKEYE